MKAIKNFARDAASAIMAIGWMGSAIAAMGARRAWNWAVSDKTEIIVAQTFPLYTAHTNAEDLFRACKIAAQGSATKATGVSIAVAATNTTVDLGNVKSFGVRVKIANSPLNFKYGAYTVNLQDGATVLSTVVIRPATNVADFVLLGTSNNGGQASVVPIANPRIVVVDATSSQTVGDAVFAETLNERDLGLLQV